MFKWITSVTEYHLSVILTCFEILAFFQDDYFQYFTCESVYPLSFAFIKENTAQIKKSEYQKSDSQ